MLSPILRLFIRVSSCFLAEKRLNKANEIEANHGHIADHMRHFGLKAFHEYLQVKRLIFMHILNRLKVVLFAPHDLHQGEIMTFRNRNLYPGKL